jgi:HAD superfamily hydrolase (TIGR01490 family)
MSGKKVIAVFDFCETLIDYQTADRFVLFILSKEKRISAMFIEWIRRILNAAHLISGLTNKKLHLLKLKGLPEHKYLAYADEYVMQHLVPSEIRQIKERLIWHREQGHTIALVSGGYTEYLRKYAMLNQIELVAGTDVEVKQDTLTGRIQGLNCLAENKLIKLSELVDLSLFDLERSYCYSDSLSDLPLMMLVGERFLVTRQDYPEWINLLNIKPFTI